MRVKQNQAYRDFLAASSGSAWRGVRIKDIRDKAITPGGRARVTLFEATGGGRAHPRLRASMPKAVDPRPVGQLFAPSVAPRTAAALRQEIQAALRSHRTVLEADDLDMNAAPKGSPRFWKNSIRAQRIAEFFRQVRAQIGSISGAEARAATRMVRELEDEVYATTMLFDDSDIGTYHSYRNDQPFVHYLERMIESLPRPNTEAFAVLPADEQNAIRRQREQLITHLDYLMRHKYAYELIEETDIERTLGGLLIDRSTRMIVSQAPGSQPMAPRYELLRIDPGSGHRHAGEWVYRDNRGGIRLQSGTAVQVPAGALRATPVSPAQLTFRRAPHDARLRPGIHFDWDGNGHVAGGKLEWVAWAGHCDVKAVIEQLGITMADVPGLIEYRSDTDASVTYDRRLLIEMLASVLELGSRYQRADGSGQVQFGEYRFGGARNDSLPDRLQFQGVAQGQGLRWPLAGRQDSFVVTSIARQNGQGHLEELDMGTVYFHCIPNLAALDFSANPLFIRTVEGDYNVIDASDTLIEASILVDEFDPSTGYPIQTRQRTLIDLRRQPRYKRCFLGTHIDDVHGRRVYKMYLDRDKNRIVGDLFVWERRRNKWQPRQLSGQGYQLSLAQPLRVTLSHEMKRDNPAMFQAVLDVALRTGENIVADTDRQAPVWNGVVTRLDVRKVAENVPGRVQRWRVDIRARYGVAALDYLVRRNELGEPVDYCPLIPEDTQVETPDFMYQEIPDVGTKARSGSVWLINKAMLDRRLISVTRDASAEGGFHVQDDHIKNVFELIYTAMAGYRYSVIHDNKRYAFASKVEWDAAVAELKRRRAALSFEP